ncbi:FAD-dependent monooxygenase [Amycolatopsis sp. NBC_00348]|uniref:FAD-dependent monooxygenase n=1 Tax=Amycolatopsis sp. NBC_00348 TaxID=2975956 RepID=UPI002E25459F
MTEVLIAGGGPVGMVLAAELALLGVGTTVLEPNLSTVDVPKAGTLHARTVQSLARRGYLRADAGHPPGARVTSRFHFAGLSGLDISGPATEGTPIVGLSQADLERHAEARARRLGATIHRGHRLTAAGQDADGAHATVLGPGGEYRISARYLVGADGARGVTREAAGFTAETQGPTIAALLGAVRLLDPAHAPAGWHRTERGWFVGNPNPYGHSRVITFDFTGPHPDRRAPLTLDELSATADRIVGRPVPMTDAVFLSRFSDYSRLVTEYRRGRVLLAGDAAHVHFPVGGQGLNLGVQDAVNLGWKLAAVLRGADESLLDTYHAERHPVAARVVHNTRAQLALMNPDPAVDPLRDLVTELLGLEPVRRHLGDMISDQEIDGFLPNASLRVNGRTTTIAELLWPGRPLLVVLDDGARPPDLPGVEVVHATATHPLPWASALIRPDGYLAWSAPSGVRDTEGLSAAAHRWFGTKAESGTGLCGHDVRAR